MVIVVTAVFVVLALVWLFTFAFAGWVVATVVVVIFAILLVIEFLIGPEIDMGETGYGDG